MIRREAHSEGPKSRFEDVGEFELYGSFTLFKELYNIIEDFSGHNIKYNSLRTLGNNIQEIMEYSLDEKLLQINVPDLRTKHEIIFWNLVHLFINDKIDYKFILPYKNDLLDS